MTTGTHGAALDNYFRVRAAAQREAQQSIAPAAVASLPTE
jgi:hypothetical protein